MTGLLAQSEVPPSPSTEASSGLPWYAYLFWAWVLVSLSVYAYRIFGRASGRRSAKASTGTVAPPMGPTTAGAGPPAAADDAASTRIGPTLRRVVERPSRPPLPEAVEGPSPTEALFLEAKAARERGEDPDAAATPDAGSGPTSDRRGLFAAEPDADAAPRRPVAELVRGIVLPCDLVPAVEGADPFGHRVAFHTGAAPAGQVGRELGDALEALGFALRSTSDTEVVASREGDELRVRIVPRAGDAVDDGQPRYPSLPAGDVVVELES